MGSRDSGKGWEYLDLSDEARRLVAQHAAAFAEAGAIMVRDEIVNVIREASPAGEVYQIPGTRSSYRASAPGQPPAVREGRYINSWQWTPAVEVEDEMVATAYSDLMVGPYVLADMFEKGTIHMEPRPHVDDGVRRAADQLRDLIEDSAR